LLATLIVQLSAPAPFGVIAEAILSERRPNPIDDERE
jgi:hypothetical protein